MNKEFLYKGKKICYQVVGEGKPVVLIHGFGEDGEISGEVCGGRG